MTRTKTRRSRRWSWRDSAIATVPGPAGVLHAQGRDTTGRGVEMPEMMAMMEMCPMMAGMADGPEAALRHSEELGVRVPPSCWASCRRGGATARGRA